MSPTAQTTPMLEVHDLYKYFPMQQSLVSTMMRRPPIFVKAVDGVSFSVARGEVLALVGESGCGKTTIAKTLIGLETQTWGEIIFNGQQVGTDEHRLQAGMASIKSSGSGSREHVDLPKLTLKRLRQQAQMIFQESLSFGYLFNQRQPQDDPCPECV